MTSPHDAAPSPGNAPSHRSRSASPDARPLLGAERRAEFERLFLHFEDRWTGRPPRESSGANWPAVRASARRGYEALIDGDRLGLDIEDLAFDKLLPHAYGSGAGQAVWRHPCAGLPAALRSRLDDDGRMLPVERETLARGLFDLVRTCDEDPSQLWQACEAFAALPGAEDFRTAVISPILNALRPDDFVLVDDAVRTTLNHFSGCATGHDLSDYPEANAAVRRLVDALHDRVASGPFAALRAQDTFCLFSHWLMDVHLLGGEDEAAGSAGRAAAPADQAGAAPVAAMPIDEADEAEAAGEAIEAAVLAAAAPGAGPPQISEDVVDPIEEAPKIEARGLDEADEPASGSDPEPEPTRASAPRPAPHELPLPDFAAEEALHLEDGVVLEPIRPDDPWLQPDWAADLDPLPDPEPNARSAPLADTAPVAVDRDEELIERALAAIERRGQVLLAGPAGRGATRLAERLAERVVEGGDGFVQRLVFHAAWTYADFVQSAPGHAGAGRLATFCRQAAARRDRCVLLIHDLHCARSVDVLGEALALLDRRGLEAALPGGGSLVIPANAVLLATADPDAGPGLLDLLAVRRRFPLLRLPSAADPARLTLLEAPLAGALGQQLEALHARLAALGRPLDVTGWIADVPAGQLGEVWRSEVEPCLELAFRDAPEECRPFRWEAIAARLP